MRALREARTGSWSDLNAGGSTNRITRNYLTLWFDHGSNPAAAAYAYVLLPCLTASNTAAYAAAPEVAVLENSASAQAVRKAATGHTAVNFWAAGTNAAAGIAASQPCSVIARSDGAWLEVAVADPTQTNTSAIVVELSAAAAGVRALDAGVTVLQLSPTVRLSVSATGGDGRSYRASLFQGKTGTVALSPAADAYVENGSNSNNNYGASTALVVKNSGGSTLTRESYLRFDLTSQTNGLLLDAALRLVYTTSNGSDQHAVYTVTNHAWTEAGIAWTNKPGSGAEIARWSVASNVPAAVQGTVGSAAKAAEGGLLDLRVAAVGGAYVAYASRENGVATNRPQLLLTLAHPPPEVALTAPAPGAARHWSQGLTLAASASAAGGSVTRVSFFDGGAELGQAAWPPYELAVTNLAPGEHRFTAVAEEEAGAAATSTPVVVSVTGAPLAGPGQALTRRNAPVEVDLRKWAGAYATPADGLCYGAGQPASGAVSLLADLRTARFAPASNFTGGASFVYTVTDRGADPRLFLYYDLEQEAVAPGGLIADASGNGRDGTLEVVGAGAGALTNSTPPVVSSQALLLREAATPNGARIRRQIGTNELSFSDQSWTFSGWFNRAAQTNEDFIFYLGDGDGFGSNEELQLFGASGSSALQLQHYIGQDAADVDLSAAGAGAGAWHHVAVTFARTNASAGVMSLYLDGSLRGSDSSFALALDQRVPAVFGGHQNAGYAVTRWFNGLLDEVAVFAAALSSNEVAALASRSVAHAGGLAATNTVSVRVLAPEEVPAATSAGVSAGGAWSMTVSGAAGLTYTVEASTNLTDWAPLDTCVAPVLPLLWSDPQAPLYPNRFYRVRAEP